MTDKEVFAKRELKILEENNVPEEFHLFFCSRAWKSGHTYGYHEAILHLKDLVDGFDKYFKRVMQIEPPLGRSESS